MSDYGSDDQESKPDPNIVTDFKEQDRYLPIANVGRVMRNALPPHGKLSKEAKETVQECVSEFISFITSQAAEKCAIEKRKTLNGEDILFAMYTLGFENYSETLKIYLAKYREFEQYEAEIKRNIVRPKRPYHRKNPKNRPKFSNRIRTSSNSSSEEYMAKNNLPALVPTSALNNNSSSAQSSENSRDGSSSYPPTSAQQQQSQSRQQQQSSGQTPYQFNFEGVSPSTYVNSNSAAGFYTYSGQSSIPSSNAGDSEHGSAHSSIGQLSEILSAQQAAQLQQQQIQQQQQQQVLQQQHQVLHANPHQQQGPMPIPSQHQHLQQAQNQTTGGPGTNAADFDARFYQKALDDPTNPDNVNPSQAAIAAAIQNNRSASSSTGNIINYGDFMNL